MKDRELSKSEAEALAQKELVERASGLKEADLTTLMRSLIAADPEHGKAIRDGMDQELADGDGLISKEMERLVASAALQEGGSASSPTPAVLAAEEEKGGGGGGGGGSPTAPSLDALQSMLHKLTVYLKIVPAFDGVVDLAVTMSGLQTFFRRCGDVADGLRSAIYANLERSMLLLPEPVEMPITSVSFYDKAQAHRGEVARAATDTTMREVLSKRREELQRSLDEENKMLWVFGRAQEVVLGAIGKVFGRSGR